MTKALWWDDWIITASAVVTVACGSVMCLMTKYGSGLHGKTLGPETRKTYFMLFYITIVTYNIGLGLIKMAILLQYYRLFVTKMRKITIWVMVVIGCWATAMVLQSIFSCTPIEGFWNKKTDPPPHCIDDLPRWYIDAAGNIASDLVIFALPIPVLWSLQLPKVQRLSLIGVFCLGFLTCVASFVRISFLGIGADIMWENVGPQCWSIGELACGIVGSCLPTLRPFLSKLAKRSARAVAHPVATLRRTRNGDGTYTQVSSPTSPGGGMLSRDAKPSIKSDGTIVSIVRKENSTDELTRPEDYEMGGMDAEEMKFEKEYGRGRLSGRSRDEEDFGMRLPIQTPTPASPSPKPKIQLPPQVHHTRGMGPLSGSGGVGGVFTTIQSHGSPTSTGWPSGAIQVKTGIQVSTETVQRKS